MKKPRMVWDVGGWMLDLRDEDPTTAKQMKRIRDWCHRAYLYLKAKEAAKAKQKARKPQ